MTTPSKPLSPVEHVLQFFEFKHLSGFMRNVSQQFHAMAHDLAAILDHGPELTTALRKLLEAKDAAVRSALLMVQAGTDQPAHVQAQEDSGWCAPADAPLVASPQPTRPVTAWTAPSTMTTSVAPNPNVIVSQSQRPKDAA